MYLNVKVVLYKEWEKNIVLAIKLNYRHRSSSWFQRQVQLSCAMLEYSPLWGLLKPVVSMIVCSDNLLSYILISSVVSLVESLNNTLSAYFNRIVCLIYLLFLSFLFFPIFFSSSFSPPFQFLILFSSLPNLILYRSSSSFFLSSSSSFPLLFLPSPLFLSSSSFRLHFHPSPLFLYYSSFPPPLPFLDLS